MLLEILKLKIRGGKNERIPKKRRKELMLSQEDVAQAISTQAIAESSLTQAKATTEQTEYTKAIADASKKQSDSLQIIAQEETKQANLTLNAKIALYKLYKASLVLGNGGTGTWMTV